MPDGVSVRMAATVVLLTGHFYDQKRRGSFHWIADEFLKAGWRVRFVSVGYSWMSVLLKDRRLRALGRLPPLGRRDLQPGLEAAFHLTPFHPVDLRRPALNRLAEVLFAAFPELWRKNLRSLTHDADLVVLESGVPILLAPVVRASTAAPMVYRVNDDIHLLRMPPCIVRAELKNAPLFERISVASPHLARRFEGHRVELDPMGLQKEMFSARHPDPFQPRWAREAVCAGTTQFDADAVAAMARLRPDWRFHVIGRLNAHLDAPNVVCYGELPFAQVVPFVQHADIGLAPYKDLPGVEYQTHHSNRMLQYTFLKLPILAPVRMTSPELPHVIGYQLGDPESLAAALGRAETFDRSSINREPPGWDTLCARIRSAAKVEMEARIGSGAVEA